MYKPHKCPLRRSFEDGVWLQYCVSPHRLQYHVKIHKLQVQLQYNNIVILVIYSVIISIYFLQFSVFEIKAESNYSSFCKFIICLYFNLMCSQLDNQLPGAVFPTVLAPIPPPKSVAADSGKCRIRDWGGAKKNIVRGHVL